MEPEEDTTQVKVDFLETELRRLRAEREVLEANATLYEKRIAEIDEAIRDLLAISSQT